MNKINVERKRLLLTLFSISILLIITISIFLLINNLNFDTKSSNEIFNEEIISFKGQINLSVSNSELNDTENQDDLYDLSWDDLMYLASLEEMYRTLNPESSPEEIGEYLKEQLDNLIGNNSNSHIPLGSGLGPWKIFGVSLTTEEIYLFLRYPVQAAQAYNASKDAISKGEEIYFNFNSDNNNQNAFRHGYWNALMEKRISKTYLQVISSSPYIVIPVTKNFPKMFADAHEYGTSGISTDMDYLNNDLGRIHGSIFKKLSDHNMSIKMIEDIATGNFYRIANNLIVSTNWEGLRPQYLYTTSTISGGLRITGFLYRIDNSLEIPLEINGQAVISIGDSAFANQTSMISISIPNTITHIGKNAFYNTNNASIYLLNRTNVPSTFDIDWNVSVNNIYINNKLCNHISKTIIEHSNIQHAELCNTCRTITNKSSHRIYISSGWEYCYDCTYSKKLSSHTHDYKGSYVNVGNAHRQYCSCGDYRESPHIGSPNNPSDRYVLCWTCDELIDTWYYLIMIMMSYKIGLENGYGLIGKDKNMYIYFKKIEKDLLEHPPLRVNNTVKGYRMGGALKNAGLIF